MIPFLLIYIPGNGEALQAASRKRNQVLLEGVNTEGVGNFKILQFAFRADSVDIELFVFFVEAGGDTKMLKGSIIKICQDCFVSSNIHGQVVVGIFPFVILGLMTVFAFLSADEHGNRSGFIGNSGSFSLL